MGVFVESVLKKLYSNDILYHYTKAVIAIDYILFNNNLKFSPRANSNDPIERENLNLFNEGGGIALDDANNVFSYQQICFCKNMISDGCYYNFNLQAEEFGFTKARMWDQYADNYNGVCLAFSKDKLLEKNRNEKYIISNVKYKSYDGLSQKISISNFENVDDKSNSRYTEEDIFIKHKDYEGENEFRVCIKEPLNGGEMRYFDVEGCLEAIIISSYVNDFQLKILKEYAESKGVPYFIIKWNERGIDIVNNEYDKIS